MAFFGQISALSAALLWSVSSFVFTDATKRIGMVQLNISRMILACILLMLTFPFLNISYDITLWQITLLSISGFIGLVIGDSALFKSFAEIGPRVSMLIMSLNPAIAAIIAYFVLGESLSYWGIIGIVITLFGVILVVTEPKKNEESEFKLTKKGIFYALLAAIGQGVGLIFAKMAFNSGDIHGLLATYIRIASAVVIMLPMAIIAKKYANPFKVFAKDKYSLMLVGVGSIIGPYLGIAFSFYAIMYTEVGIASTIMATVPIIMLPISYFYYKEKISSKSVSGAFIAVAGVCMLFLLAG